MKHIVSFLLSQQLLFFMKLQNGTTIAKRILYV